MQYGKDFEIFYVGKKHKMSQKNEFYEQIHERSRLFLSHSAFDLFTNFCLNVFLRNLIYHFPTICYAKTLFYAKKHFLR